MKLFTDHTLARQGVAIMSTLKVCWRVSEMQEVTRKCASVYIFQTVQAVQKLLILLCMAKMC